MKHKLLLGFISLTVMGGGITFLLTPHSDANGEPQAVPAGQSITAEDIPTEKPMAPDFELLTIDGETVRLSDYRGKAVLLNFWATWCVPCREEIPDLVKLTGEIDPEKFVVLGLTLQSGPVEKVRGFAEEYNMNYPVLWGEDETMVELTRLYSGVQAIPTSFLIDPEGRIRKRYVGRQTREEFRQDIESVLSEYE